MQNIGIINNDICNLDSVVRIINIIGHNPRIVNDPKDFENLDKIILPGVGSFAAGMECLKRLSFTDEIKNAVVKNKPILGICLGMQLLFSNGEEGGHTEGLGLIEGKVIKMIPQLSNEKIPHVGWNEVIQQKSDVLFAEIPDLTDFYFVHSYHVHCQENEQVIATTPYCGDFAAVVKKDNIYGVQFHPEKSHKFGIQILKNFASL